jgi:hypothetical protein
VCYTIVCAAIALSSLLCDTRFARVDDIGVISPDEPNSVLDASVFLTEAGKWQPP